MTRIYALICFTALTLNACATAGPIAVKCGLQDIAIAANDYAEIAADIQSKNWDDLAKEGEKLGWATLDCVLGDQVAHDPGVKPNVDEFKRLKSVEFRSAGVSACEATRAQKIASITENSRGSLTAADIALLPELTDSELEFIYRGWIDAASMRGGKPLTGLVTGHVCSCWRESKANWRASRWVPVGARL